MIFSGADKIEGKNLSYQKAQDDLGRILRDVAEELTPLAEEKKVKIRVSADGVFTAHVNPLIYDVFSNILINAIKYGQSDLEITAGIERDDSNWKVSVADSGEGIPDGDRQAIFDRFKRVNKGAIKGVGLGRAIVKKVVEVHKGRVWAEDNLGGGSIFFFTIPIN